MYGACSAEKIVERRKEENDVEEKRNMMGARSVRTNKMKGQELRTEEEK